VIGYVDVIMNEIWIVKGETEWGDTVYLADYAGDTRSDVVRKVIRSARREGFDGTFDERMSELDWQLVQARIVEKNVTKYT
jgi:hypothetical protein